MVFSNLKLPCGVCEERREEQFFETRAQDVTVKEYGTDGPPAQADMPGHPAEDDTVRVSIRFCNDKPECRERSVDLLRERVKQAEGRGY